MNMNEFKPFDGAIISKNFASCKRAIASGNDIILPHPFMVYTTLIDGRIQVKILSYGIDQRQRWPEWRYPMTDSLKEELARIESIVSSSDNQAMVKAIANICGVSDTYLRQQISRNISIGVNVNGATPMQAIGVSGKAIIESCKFDDVVGKVKIDIGRACDNNDKNTFDYITVDVIIKLPHQEAKTWLKDNRNRKDILRYAINAVANRASFKKFNVPVNFLRIDGLLLSRDCTLHITFGLKGDEIS